MNDAAVILTVRSKGLVITPLSGERIFERFYRAPETHHLPAGTGLGLSIVKKIVEAHHGSVWAEGEADYGTSFSVSLPAAPRDTNMPTDNGNILVTDDDPDLRRVLRRTLDALGFRGG